MSDLRTMLEDAIGKLFADRVTKESIERAEGGEVPEALWSELEAGGFTRPHLREAAGGAGGSWLDAFVILRAAGRACVPLPLAETILGGWLLDQAGIDVPEGPLGVLAAGLPPAALRGGLLTAAARRVPYGRVAKHLVFVVCTTGAESIVGLCETAAATVAPGENLAREPRDDVSFEKAPVLARAPVRLVDDPMRVYGALVRSAQIAGALDSVLGQTVRYTGERVQFGKPIGSFQVIQQYLAVMAGHVAAATVAAEAAARAAAEVQDPTFEIAVARVRTAAAVEIASSTAHQVHGAIGFTYEHGLHFATRRLWSWRGEFGAEPEWAAWLGRTALRAGANGLWPLVTSR
jgi:acyl-CoA dehydrogenase